MAKKNQQHSVTPLPRPWCPSWLFSGLAWAARLLVVAVFVVAAAPKLMDPASFALTIYRYNLLPDGLVQPMAIFMPWLEMLAALAHPAGSKRYPAS